jgi:superfamily II DNA or RNA helicase
MALTDLVLQDAYDTGNRAEKVVSEFYVPVLQEAVLYRRLTGYFSSQVLALAARGIAGLIQNGGKMQLITSPVVSEQDFIALTNESTKEIQDFVNRQFEIAMKDINDLASTIAYDHIRALGWMLREGLLEIRVLVPSTINSGAGIFHSKVGVIEDKFGNQISFSGSVNETAMGWSQNIEEFKVFKSWDEGSKKFFAHDVQTFEKYWSHATETGFEAVPLPQKSVERLISIAPADVAELNLTYAPKNVSKKPRAYQIEAIRAWEKANHVGILEMATGTGKTFTARQCVDKWKESKVNSIILVTAPTQTVASQWQEVLHDLDPITTFGSKPWRESIRNLASKTKLGLIDHLVVIAIQNTACSDDFVSAFTELMDFTDNRLMIADEMHGLGAAVFRKALNPGIQSRLGLTATPNRWFDDAGTAHLNDYFGGVVYSFGLHEALTWKDPDTGLTPLCPYNYFPKFIDLNESEMDEYLELTRQIIWQSNKSSDPDSDERIRRLQDERARVLKNAHGKLGSLQEILGEIGNPTGCLIYCSDREQINEAIELVSRKKITYRTFTGEEGTSPKKEYDGKSERDWILESFESGEIQVLIAMKCLDEGVDIPSARLGIIMASTTNPREFIQRRGRLLRRAPGKEFAQIYDMIVAPIFPSADNSEELKSARRIMEKELKRSDEFAKDALNSTSISGKVLGRMLEMGGLK